MIDIKDCTIRYPKTTAIDNLSLRLNEGTIYGLVGPNGAGKSSLINAMVGLISKYEGNIKYNDLSLRNNRHQVKHLFGYAPEDPDLYSYLTGKEYLYMLADIRKCRSDSQINSMIENFFLKDVCDELIDSYSHGMRQKISFVAALIGEPQHLILDEALNGFDPVSLHNAKNLLKNLAEKGHMVFLSSHVLELLENWCQEIIILNEGKIVAQYTIEQINEIKNTSGLTFSDHFINLVKDTHPKD